MPRFLAVYTMQPKDLDRFRRMPKHEQDAVNAIGIKRWTDWEARHAASFSERGMVGKTTRVTKGGIAEAVNPFCGYIVVEAETIEAAARLFENHPHFSIFPGDGVDIMPFLTDPAP
ncbi:hypothetical protein [Devosia psychrophila]|uniref:YCII-related domain-containing protein n=1 Tax=Devosia psychrophila TaxID=728005 RepID=A0A0F5PTQ1_9HYPH|nr:hypothetical protein [Devosia psychrophila]KKC32057.1 hypothetical protein WH91_16140 [Devosia psychrophila]SFD36441.1 hypothetical protein SAMN04488059_1464 [Devosia psychrophila]